MDKVICMTHHGAYRIKGRVGKKIDPRRFVEDAVSHGLYDSDLKGNLRLWVRGQLLPDGQEYAVVHRNYLLVVSGDDRLITTYAIPGHLQPLAAKLEREKKRKNDNPETQATVVR